MSDEKKDGLFSNLTKILVGGVPASEEKDIKDKVLNTGGNYHKVGEEKSIFGKFISFIVFWQKGGDA